MSDKYVLIVDVTSKGCFDCPAHQWVDDDDGGEMLFCSAENWRKPVTHTPIPAREALERPSWCPLKPLPQKNKYDVKKYPTVDHENAVTLGHYLNIGWNAYRDEIVGESNEK